MRSFAQETTCPEDATSHASPRERLLAAVLDHTPECVKLVGEDGTLLDMNSAGLTLIGADSWEQVAEANVFDLVAPEHHQAFDEFNQRVFAGFKARLIFEINALNGIRRWMDSTAVPLELPGGEVVHLAITRDITQEKLAAEELAASKDEVESLNDSLHASHELTNAILESAADGVLLLSAEGSIQRANRAAAELFGRTPDELKLLNVRHLIVEQELADDWLNLLSHQRHRGERFLALRSNGEQFAAELSASRVGAVGKTLFTWIVRDVSQRERLESQLVAASKLESIGRLSAGLSHEISTPIQFIDTNIGFLRRQSESFKLLETIETVLASDAPDREKLAELKVLADCAHSKFDGHEAISALEDCSLGLNRVMQIVRAMRAYAHPGEGQLETHDVNQLLRDALVLARNRLNACADVTLHLCEDARLHCNPSAISQTALNLLVNAADAIESKQAGVDLWEFGEITITTKRTDEGLKIRFTDSGCGMAESTAQHAFEPFYTTKEIGKGTGQGLAIVYNAIVAMHGGSIEIESEVNSGTTFHIFLPETRIDARAPEKSVTLVC